MENILSNLNISNVLPAVGYSLYSLVFLALLLIYVRKFWVGLYTDRDINLDLIHSPDGVKYIVMYMLVLPAVVYAGIVGFSHGLGGAYYYASGEQPYVISSLSGSIKGITSSYIIRIMMLASAIYLLVWGLITKAERTLLLMAISVAGVIIADFVYWDQSVVWLKHADDWSKNSGGWISLLLPFVSLILGVMPFFSVGFTALPFFILLMFVFVRSDIKLLFMAFIALIPAGMISPYIEIGKIFGNDLSWAY